MVLSIASKLLVNRAIKNGKKEKICYYKFEKLENKKE